MTHAITYPPVSQRKTSLIPLLALLALLAFSCIVPCPAIAQRVVGTAYIVPENREPQPTGVANLQAFLPTMQEWFADQMERYGFGRKTFNYETEADGKTPRVRVIRTSRTDANLRADIWGNTLAAAQEAGLPLYQQRKQTWIMVPESHIQASDGKVTGGTALGAGFGSGDDSGIAMVGSDMLFRLNPELLDDNIGYNGKMVPEIGPHPLVFGKSFPDFEQSTFSSIASSAQGALAHELGHAFGLGHEFRNDLNFRGPLMGNGLRGWRGDFHPDRYSSNNTQLSYAAALSLNVNRFFNAEQTFTDSAKPRLRLTTRSGAADIVDGHVQIKLNATDAVGLAAAVLRRNGDVVGEMKLNGTAQDILFNNPFYTPGVQDRFDIDVFDLQGNKQTATLNLTPNAAGNRAPQPWGSVLRSIVDVGELLTLDSSGVTDPDHAVNRLLVEWDLDFDGVFDTVATRPGRQTVSYNTPGVRMLQARFRDPAGAVSYSSPVAVRVVPEPSALALSMILLALGACVRPARK